MLRAIDVTLTGTTALLMHRYPLEPIEAIEKKPAVEQAELAAYRDPHTGRLYVPGPNVQSALVAAAAFSKGKGRASLQKTAAACLTVTPDRLDLGLTDYVVDSRPIRNPSTGGRILRHRPRVDAWTVSFQLEYDDTLLKATEVRRIVDDAGSRVGLLDFRPACKGPYGRSVVTSWEEA